MPGVLIAKMHTDIFHHQLHGRALGRYLERDAFIGLKPEYQDIGFGPGQVADIAIAFHGLEQLQGRRFELDRDFRYPAGQPFTGAQIERHPAPAPVADLHPQRTISGGVGVGIHPVLLPVAGHRLAIEQP